MKRKDELKDVLEGAIKKSREAAVIPCFSGREKLCFVAFSISIIMTMLPADHLVIAASISSLFFLTELLIIAPKRLKNFFALSLISLSVISGCAGPLLSQSNREILHLCSETTGESCKEKTIQSWYIFGIPTSNISPRDAALLGGIKHVVAIDHVRGYGLIGLETLTVLGS